jgi:Arabinose-binding domain of AraC transcription regulator, N-term
VPDLLLCAKHLFVAATVVAIARAGGSRMSNQSSSALNSEQGLASIPMAGGGLSRLAVARLESAGVPVAPLLKRVGLTPELIADPEQRLSVQSQIRLLDEAAIALKDDCLGFTLARDHDPRNRAALLRHGVVADLGRWIEAGCSIQQDHQRVPRGRISRGKQARYQPELLWRASALRQTSS